MARTYLTWARRLQQRGWAHAAAIALEALEPVAPLGAALFAGGGFMLSPWVPAEKIEALSALLADPTQRQRLVEALHAEGANER